MFSLSFEIIELLEDLAQRTHVFPLLFTGDTFQDH